MTTLDVGQEHSLLREVLGKLRLVHGPDDRGECICWCCFHADGQGKLPHQPNLHVSARGFYCHACGAKGSLERLAEHLGVRPAGDTQTPEAVYSYQDEGGNLLFQVVRFRGKRFRQRRPDGKGGWIWNLAGIRRVLYRLPELLGSTDKIVLIAEGEKDCDRLIRAGMIATTNPGGAGKWRPEYNEPLRGRAVAIIADNDRPGRQHAHDVAHSLHGVTESSKLIDLPDLPEKGDVTDFLADGHDIEELRAIVAAAPVWQPSGEDPPGEQAGDGGSEKRRSQADRLASLALAGSIGFFHDDLGDTYAHVPINNHREVWPCRAKSFRTWLSQLFWRSERKALASEALNAALNVLEATARFDGKEHHLFNRVAMHEDAIWYDLVAEDWRVVRITSQGWEIVSDPPILFRRYSHQRPQPNPVRGGDLHELLHLLNIRDPRQELLILVHIVSCFIPDIAHPILLLYGPQGSTKTTMFRMLRGLVDPSATAVMSFPRDTTELVQQLSHHWTPYFDNITILPDAISDLLCRAVTGEGFTKRVLYSDDEDILYQFRRCVGLNGINVAARKTDLLDRCILLSLEPIAPDKRRPEQELWERYDSMRPYLLGAIFDVLSRAMALRLSIRVSRLPRLADFALWGCAIARAMGYSEDSFMMAYEDNAATRDEEALHASPVAAMVRELMEGRMEWDGTPSELLTELEKLAGEHQVNTNSRGWPKAAHSLSRRLNEARANLTAVGVTVATRRDGQHRLINIRKTPVNSVTGDTSVTKDEEPRDADALANDAIADITEEPSLETSTGQARILHTSQQP